MNLDTSLGLDVTGFTGNPPGSTLDRNGGSYEMSSLNQLKKKVSKLGGVARPTRKRDHTTEDSRESGEP
jgi:hypothetical protein